MATMTILSLGDMQKWRLLISIKKKAKDHPEKEHVTIRDTAKFQSCWLKTPEMADI